jgi:hypothetical protein
MTRLVALASALSLAALAACASETDAGSAAADAPRIAQALVEPASAPLPQAVAVEGPVDALQLPVAYNCEQGRTFVAVFPGHGRSVTVAAAGQTRVLPHRGAADAVMFSDAGVTMTADGADATLTGLGDGPYTGCMAG